MLFFSLFYGALGGVAALLIANAIRTTKRAFASFALLHGGRWGVVALQIPNVIRTTGRAFGEGKGYCVRNSPLFLNLRSQDTLICERA